LQDDSGIVPFRLRIGVTGHRNIAAEPPLVEIVRAAVDRARQLALADSHSPLEVAIVSSLAEGADRLVADVVLTDADAQLEAVLPLPADDFRTDFLTEESRRDFDRLLGRSTRIVELPMAETREESYEQAGRYVVERCDILIALWDGLPSRGQGGTADIVEWARDRRVPLLWIHTQPALEMSEELGDGLDTQAFQDLDRYNSAHLPRDAFRAGVDGYVAQIHRQAQACDVDAATIAPFSDWLAPHFVRADLLAVRYQGRFFRLSDGIFLLTALAVVASAGAELAHGVPWLVRARLFSRLRPLPLVESAAMLLVLIILYLVRRRAFHRGWIYHRILAERLRSALFLALVSLDRFGERETEHVDLHQASESWLERAFDEIWNRRPSFDPTVHLDKLRHLLAEAWIGDQAAYQIKKSRRHEWNNKLISSASVGIFFATLLIAGLSALGVTADAAGEPPPWTTIVIYLSVVLPAVASALGAIGAQREHRRNAQRSGRMARYLRSLQQRMDGASDLPTIHAVARQASEVMIQDIDDWFVTMEFRDVELQG
jgi:hypothetical protein